MKFLIEIDNDIYEHAKDLTEDSYDEFAAMRAIANGTPIKDGGICDICKCQELGMMAVCFHCNAELKEAQDGK